MPKIILYTRCFARAAHAAHLARRVIKENSIHNFLMRKILRKHTLVSFEYKHWSARFARYSIENIFKATKWISFCRLLEK